MANSKIILFLITVFYTLSSRFIWSSVDNTVVKYILLTLVTGVASMIYTILPFVD